ncbi:MAG TPA: SusC/RagA family TonB-linked outer membrane protein, partial [Sediminibacterium sp.]
DFIEQNGGSYTGVGINNVNATTPSTASVDNRKTYHWVIENMLTYDRTFAQKHNVNVVALYSAERNKYNRSSMSAKNIPSDAFQFYNIGQANSTDITVDPNGQDYQMWGLTSLMGRVMYSYDNRYMLSATVRSDASSRLASGFQWHTYPAVSAGWNISNESFMQNVTWVDRLKLFAGYGQTSNQAIAPYATLGRLATNPYNFGDNTYATGYYVSQLPNSKLGWEYSETWNFGLDFTLLKNRLSGKIEYYVTNTKDILLGVGLPPTSGVSSYTANIGQTQNKGIELSLNGTIIDNKNGWSWDAGVNFYANRNKLVALASGQVKDEGNGWFVGHNINALFDYQYVGLWQSKDTYLSVLEPGGNVGMIKVKYTGDYKSDGTPVRAIGPDDRQVMDVDPDFQGGFNTRVTYKGFDLSVVGAFKSGGILISNLNGPYGYLNLESGRRNNIKIDYWTTDNTDAKYPKPGGIMSSDNPKYASTLSYFDGSYMKIRTISLGYNLAQASWMKRSGISNLRLYFTVQNPFVMFSPFYKEMGVDPETNSLGNQNVATGGYQSRLLTVGFNTPSTRNYVVGLNMTF